MTRQPTQFTHAQLGERRQAAARLLRAGRLSQAAIARDVGMHPPIVVHETHTFGGRQLKWSYVTRVIPDGTVMGVGPNSRKPEAGDVVVARVHHIGAHDHIEDPVGRARKLYEGDFVIGAYGNRYATDFYEGYVPEGQQTHLLTAGGLIGTVKSAHDAVDEPTKLEIVGALVDEQGTPVTLSTFAHSYPSPAVPGLGTIVVVGSGMNSGKTTTVASIVQGLSRAGLAVGAGKATGSGSGKDRWAYVDAGASHVADFLDYGMPSTFGYPREQLKATTRAVCHELASAGTDAVVLEIADGILQEETAWLLDHVAEIADGIAFAAVDSLSACHGVQILREHRLPVRAVTGLVTRSPLASREIQVGVPVLSPADLVAGGALGLLSGQEA
jgi:hypothetical protein